MVSHQCRKQQWLFLALPNTELSGCYSVPWLHCSLGLRGVCECVFLTAWIVRKHLWEWQPAPPPLMSAEWTNPHTTHSAWQQVAVTVPFSSLPSFFFLVFSSVSASLSLSLFLSRCFLRFFTCVLFIFHFSFFCIIFLVLAKPTEELAITTVVGNLLPAFQYTHRHTFAHSSTYTIPCSSPNANKPKTTTQHRGLHFPLPPGRGGFKTFEAHPHSDLSLREKAPVSCCKIKIKGLGLSLEDLHLTLF